MSKAYRFPEGIYTEQEWVERFADRLEEIHVSWESLIDRRRWNRMGHHEQEAYEARLQRKAQSPVYLAWRGDTSQIITKSTYLQARRLPRFARSRDARRKRSAGVS